MSKSVEHLPIHTKWLENKQSMITFSEKLYILYSLIWFIVALPIDK